MSMIAASYSFLSIDLLFLFLEFSLKMDFGFFLAVALLLAHVKFSSLLDIAY